MARRLAAILAADVVGYSRLMAADEAGTLAALTAHRKESIEPKIAEHHGRIVKLMGDGALWSSSPAWSTPSAARSNCRRALAERARDVAQDRQIRLRIGINLGDILIEDDDIHGDGVNVAARLEALAEPGGICVSRTVRNHVQDKLALAFEDLGERTLKNIPRPGAGLSRRCGWRGARGREQGGSRRHPVDLARRGGCDRAPGRRRRCRAVAALGRRRAAIIRTGRDAGDHLHVTRARAAGAFGQIPHRGDPTQLPFPPEPAAETPLRRVRGCGGRIVPRRIRGFLRTGRAERFGHTGEGA